MAVQNQRDPKSTTPTKMIKLKSSYNSIMPTKLQKVPTVTSQSKVTTGSATSRSQHQTNGTGPRVSFNRDVHIKRIAKHPNEKTNFEQSASEIHQHQAYHQIPSLENINKEAAIVLEQAGSYKSKAENAESIPIFRVKTKVSGGGNKFNSLPNRKKKTIKPLTRSSSDASNRKPVSKRPSILNLFSRKSESHVNQLVERGAGCETNRGPRLVRSKSDVGSATIKEPGKLKKYSNDSTFVHTTNSSPFSVRKPISTQLSPIIENSQKEDYFADDYLQERRKSEGIIKQEKKDIIIDNFYRNFPSITNGENSIVKNPISQSIKDKILTLHARSNENMHCSQLPAEKLPLTRGKQVNGMVKRLSRERFSPPPTISQPAFSYIRPNDGLNISDPSQQQPNFNNSIPSPLAFTKDLNYCSPGREDSSTANRNKILNTLNDSYMGKTSSHEHPSTNLYPITKQQTFDQTSVDQTDYHNASQNNLKSTRHINNVDLRTRYSPPAHASIRISTSHSISPWQQLSPRNLSDEDEGLGIETLTSSYDDSFNKINTNSEAEPPIVPVIRGLTPTNRDIGSYYSYNNNFDKSREDVADDLGYRRECLESRILTRRFGDGALAVEPSPDSYFVHRYLSSDPEREETRNSIFHKPQMREFSGYCLNGDVIAPSKTPLVRNIYNEQPTTKPEITANASRNIHTKYQNNDHSVIKDAHKQKSNRNDHERHGRHNMDQNRSSPEYLKNFDGDSEFNLSENIIQHPNYKNGHISTLNREKRQQRSFDKGDSGIENDCRKESFNGSLFRSQKQPFSHVIEACKIFLNEERRHSEDLRNVFENKALNHQHYLNKNYVYRERSIDDGSHYDPHLDKYTVSKSTLRRWDHHSEKDPEQNHRNKKISGFEKVKQLFSGSKNLRRSNQINVMNGANENKSTTNVGTRRDSEDRRLTAKTPRSLSTDKYMVEEEEMRMRYNEHRDITPQNAQKANDISLRRRLSTPKASPLLLKRTSSEKPKKISPLVKPEKLGWFKSLDRQVKSKSKEKLNGSRKSQSEISSSLNRPTTVSSKKRATSVPASSKNLRFFGDTDLDSNPPTISKANASRKARQPIPTSTTAPLNLSQKYSQSALHLDRLNNSQQRGDYRHTLAAQKNKQALHKSTSLHNLIKKESDEVDFRSKRRLYSRSHELDDISESASEAESQHRRNNGDRTGNGVAYTGRTTSRERVDRSHRYEDDTFRRNIERKENAPHFKFNGQWDNNENTRQQRKLHALGPPKPARSIERQLISTHPRDHDRFPAESSGTEGESSLQSQRSVVYLHATTVGAIPQPYQMRRRSTSRDDLRSIKSKNQKQQTLQPMTRTVSRSVSMLAPWKPKFISDGYEINYSQEQNKKLHTTLPRSQHLRSNTNTSTRSSRKKSETLTEG